MMTKNQFRILHDCIDRINTLRNPQAWEIMDHKLIRNEINRAIAGLQSINVAPIDLIKASRAMSYGEPKLAYQYMFVTSTPRSGLAEQLNRSVGPARGVKGAFKDLIDMYKAIGPKVYIKKA